MKRNLVLLVIALALSLTLALPALLPAAQSAGAAISDGTVLARVVNFGVRNTLIDPTCPNSNGTGCG
jgi:hypothetical protein